MAMFKKRRQEPEQETRPLVTDDFIYDDPDAKADNVPPSDTPEEAIRKLRGRRGAVRVSASRKGRSSDSVSGVSGESTGVSGEGTDFSGTDSGFSRTDSGFSGTSAKFSGAGTEFSGSDSVPSEEDSDAPDAEAKTASAENRKVYSSGVMLDENLQPIAQPKERRHHPVIRGAILGAITLVLMIFVGAYIFHRILPDTPLLGAPENAISEVVSPVQTFFSGLTESLFGYFRSMKLRANLESAYEELLAENEQLVYKAMLADELQQTLSQYEDLSDEIAANAAMRPIVSTVVGRSDSNYFSTLTINKGLADGVQDYMAVTISGALVGYTESVQEHKATVRTIIDSEASIAGLIQSSRDQGTVRGTLGIDGTPMCRMYYLPDDNLPRPGDLVVTSGVGMSFPKGIPIGIVRESTRGMDANKQYIVLEPQVDFQHLEYVIVLRYKPEPLAVEGREASGVGTEFVPLESARPSPIVPEIASSLFESQSTEVPEDIPEPMSPDDAYPGVPLDLPDAEEPLEGSAESEGNPEGASDSEESPDGHSDSEEPARETPGPTPTGTPAPAPEVSVLDYQVVNPRGEPTPTATPTIEPTPTPYFTPDPDNMIFEED